MTKERGHYLILNRDSFHCVYCGASPTDDLEVKLTVDHILPVKRGGSDRADNLVTSCLNCNSQKQDRVMGQEVMARFVAMTKQRNQAAGIADHQIVRLKGSSSQARSRREWDALTVRVLQLIFNMLWRDHDTVAANRASTIADIFALAIQTATEYTRLTGDTEKAQQATSLLRSMAVDTMAAMARAFGTVEPDLESLGDSVDLHLEPLDAQLIQAWLGVYGIGSLIECFVRCGLAKVGDIEIFGERLADATDEDASSWILDWQEHINDMRAFQRRNQ